MSIDFDCPACGRTLRVNEKYAGRRSKCPACDASLQVPDDEPELELLPEDRGTYEVVIVPEKRPTPPPPPPAPEVIAEATKAEGASGSPNRTDFSGGREGKAVDPWLATKLRALDREPEPDPWWKKELISFFGLAITPVWLLLIPATLLGVFVWYTTGPGRPAHLGTPQPVHIVQVLDTAEIQTSRTIGGSPVGLPLGALTGGSGSGSSSLSVGGHDELVVSRPDKDGDYILLNVRLKQGTLNNLGQLQKYDTVIVADRFELRKRDEATGSGVRPRLVTDDFTQPVDLDLAGASTSSYQAMLPPVTQAQPDRLDEEKSASAISGEAEYAFGDTKGTVSFSASRSSHLGPGGSGLYGDGQLTTRHPDGGPEVVSDYQGSRLRVSWDSGSEGHWIRDKVTEPTAPSPWTRHEFSLLFPRPAEGGTYVLTLADKPIGTIDLPRAKQPSAPAPSPIASGRPGGPSPSSKHSSGPLAYFDVLRDARSQAQGLVSANNMRQIGFALQSYLSDHRGQFPDTLLELEGYVPIHQLMVNPRTGENPGFIYEKPQAGANPGTTPVVYEALGGKKDPTGAVLYADGSVR